MDRYRTTTVLPFAHLAGATFALRTELHRLIAADDERRVADWSTLRVMGPEEVYGPHGAVHFEYRGSVDFRRLAALPNRATRSRH